MHIRKEDPTHDKSTTNGEDKGSPAGAVRRGDGRQDPKGELMRLAMRLIVEEALEAKTRDLLGRGYYERGGEAGEGYRNGHRETGVKTAEGKVRYAVPQVRDLDARELAELRRGLKGRTDALEKLAMEMYARGCSDGGQ